PQAAARTATTAAAAVEEVCTSKTEPVSFTTPGTPPPPPTEDVRQLTVGKDSFVIKTAKTEPTACSGAPCTVTDDTVMRIGGTGSDKTAAVLGLKLDELPGGAGVSEGILKLGTPTCDGGACPEDTVISVVPLKSAVTSETKGSDLAADVESDVTPHALPINAPQADIAGFEDQWLLLTSNKDMVIRFGDATAAEQPSLALRYLPAGPPSNVLNLTAQSGDASATASWGMPASNGGVALLDGYDVEVSDSSGSVIWTLEVETPYVVITGLSNGQTYTIRVRSKTVFGASGWESTSVAPEAVPPPPAAGETCVLEPIGRAAKAAASTTSGAQEYINRVKQDRKSVV